MPSQPTHAGGRPARGQQVSSANLPRITIEQTPFNDLYLILDTLFPSAQTSRILRDPRSFARSQEESLRLAWQMIQHSIETSAPQRATATADGKPANGVQEPENGPSEPTTPAPHRQRIRRDGASSRTMLR
jgi:hypothetical protein